jgi:hypothetical protein
MIRRGFALFPAALALLCLPRPLAGAAGQALVPIPPCRAVDTRSPAGPNGGPSLAANETRLFTITGTCGVPSNALGLAVNLTVVAAGATGFAQLYAGDAAVPPPTHVLIFSAGQTRAASTMVALASDASGTVALANVSPGPDDFIIDIAGYWVLACTSTIGVTNPSTATGVVNAPFSQTFTSSGGTGAKTYSTTSTLPAGLTLAANGTLSGTPTQNGTFPITVTATDANGCTGTGSTYTLVIACQSITVTNPGVTTGTANAPFSQTFTQSGGVGTTTFSTSSPLPIGMTLAANGVLSGTPTQAGGFPIVVVATDANACTGTGATYTLVINCQTITVTNPGVTTGTAGQAFSQTFTQAGAIGTETFTTTSTLPTGLTLSAGGVLSGTPTVTGTFPIVVKVRDGNLCTGTGPTYTLVIGCGTIVVSNPATATATAGSGFSQTFTQAGAIGSATFTTSSTLPTGLTLSAGGVLSGTPTVTGTFSIVVKVTDANGCIGIGVAYTLVVNCQTWSVLPSAAPQATASVPYTVTLTQTGGIGAVTYAVTAGTLPAGLSLASGGVLSGTTAQTGSFPITVTATDANGCTATRDYLLVVSCSGTSITLSPGSLAAAPANAPFPSTTFTATGGTGPYTFAQAGKLPAGMSFVVDTLSGTPTQTGTFPITISATDASGCAGSQDYVVTITCNGVTITVAPPSLSSGPVGSPYGPVTFTASGGTSPYTLAETGALPAGMTFAAGVLSGTPTQPGTFPVTVTATDANGCSGQTIYSLVTTCPTITVTNPATATGTAGTAFSQTFTQSGGSGTVAFSTSSTLPTGITLNSSTGVLSGTTNQAGTFPIVVTATDANGCTGNGATYNLVIACQIINVTNPVTTAGTEGNAFDQVFTATGILGTDSWSTASTLPTGLTLSSSTGHLSGTPTQSGSFPIVVKATDTNGCFGTGATYTLVLTCPTITVSGTIPALTYNTAMSTATFTQLGTSSTITWSATGLPAGLGINSANGQVTGTPTTTGTFSATIKATDAGGCTGSKIVSVAVLPAATSQAYTGVGNTQLYVTGVSGPPATPAVASGTVLLNGAQPAGGVAVTAASCSVGGTIATFDATGHFIFTPSVAATSATCTYAVSSDTGSTGTPTTAIASLTFTLTGMVWYVDNASGGSHDGRSNTPFTTMTAVGGAATNNGDFIYVAHGSGSTTGAYTMKTSQQLIGAGATLTVGPLTVAGNAANTPTLSGTLTLASSVVVNGIDMSTGSSTAITGTSVAGINVTARSISSSGAPNGIFLSTMTGSFTVTGDGSDTSVGGNGTGGTISNATGADGAAAGSAIYLNNVQNVTLRRMAINGANQNYAIRGFSVSGFTLEYSTIAGTNGTSNTADQDAGTVFAGEGSLRFTELTGSVSILNSVLDGGFSRTMAVHNSSGTMNLTIDNSTVRDTSTNAATTDAFFMQASNAATMNLTVQNNSLFTAYRQNAIATDARDTSTMSINISNSVFSNSNAALIDAGGSLSLGSSASTDTLVQFNIHDNSFRHGAAGSGGAPNNGGAHLVCGTISGAGKFDGKFVNNTVGVRLVAFSGAGNDADALRVFASGNKAGTTRVTGTTDSRFLIQGNTIMNYGEAGIQINARQGNSVLDTTVFGNTINEPGSSAGAFAGIWVNTGALPGDANIVNIVIGDASVSANKNAIQGSDPSLLSDVFLENDSSTSATLNLYKNGSASTTLRQVILDDNNPPPNLDPGGLWLSLVGGGSTNLVAGTPPSPP